MQDPGVLAAAAAEAAASGRTVEAVMAHVRAYADEIVPQYNARFHHRVAYRLARRVATTLFRVRVGHADQFTLRRIPADASVVFVINHRSNIDYVLVAFLAAEHVALSFAVGEWARVWPLDVLIRALGAFFVRRSSRNALYRKVLECYVQQAVHHGVTQGMFMEGGLSRDGRLQPPRLGLLSYATRHMTRDAPRDVVFVPVALNYDRVLEDRTLLRDRATGARTASAATAAAAAAWVAKNVGLYVRGRLHRFGYACVNFGPPLSLRLYLEQRGVDLAALPVTARFAETERLAQFLMDAIAQVVPVTPVSLLASALLSFDDAPSRAELEGRVRELVEELGSTGAHLYVPRQDAIYCFDVGVRMLVLRRFVTVDGDAYRIVPEHRELVAFYANSIAHFAGTRPSAPAAPAIVRPVRATRSVVLVHGLARTSRSMNRLADTLAREGYAIWNWDYPSRHYGLLALVDALHDYVQESLSASDRVDFVTHSMGGLLARGVLARRAFANVGRLVMVGPPNQGSRLATRAGAFTWARGVYGQALQDLRSDRVGEVVAHLGAPTCEFGVIAGTRGFHPLQPTSYYTSFTQAAGSHDGTVGVEETRLEGMTDFITVDANHLFLVDHDETIRQTVHFLASGRFDHVARRGTE